jgi:hypothetical protein
MQRRITSPGKRKGLEMTDWCTRVHFTKQCEITIYSQNRIISSKYWVTEVSEQKRNVIDYSK